MDKMTPDALALTPAKAGSPPAPSSPPAMPSGEARRRAILTRTVQLEVIPQLLRRPDLRRAVSPAAPLDTHVPHLAALALQGGSRETIEFVTGLFDSGVSAESIYLDLLAPTAALLGEYWVDDVHSFADVTVAAGHLQTALRVLRPAFLSDAPPLAPGAPRALLLPLPGAQHTFGLSMLAAFFVRAGWDVWSGAVDRAAELHARVRKDSVDLVGFSVNCDSHLETAQQAIAAVRAASRNKDVIVMVGGLPFVQDPALARAIGADGTASDGRAAVATAATLLPRPVRSP